MRVLFAPERDARVFRDSDNYLADTVKHNLWLETQFGFESTKTLAKAVRPTAVFVDGQVG